MDVKRCICLLVMLGLILCGCEMLPAETAPTTTAPATLLEQGKPWGQEGQVLELPLELPGATGNVQLEKFGDQLLLWQLEYEEDGITGIRLWMVDPVYGSIEKEQFLETSAWMVPQIQPGRICLCSSENGSVIILSETLEIAQEWSQDPDWCQWVMGFGSKLYIFMDQALLERDLDTGEERNLLDDVSGIYAGQIRNEGAGICYSESGQRKTGYLNFETGQIEEPPFRGMFDESGKTGEEWLCRKYIGAGRYRLGSGTAAWDVEIPEGFLQLTEQGIVLSQNGEALYLFDREGRFIAGCRLGQEGYATGGTELIWSDALDGYLMLARDWEGTSAKLLFWAPRDGAFHEDLVLTPVDLTLSAEAELELLRQRADVLGQSLGLVIRIGTDCQTDYQDFNAVLLTDPDYVAYQLRILERALAAYPEGFFQQLCYDSYAYIDIHLIGELTAKPHYGTGDRYGGFVQPQEDHYLMVIDGMSAGENTYYHEFSHIIDDYLAWNSWQREDALFSEERWLSLNPEDFEYTWDYAREQELTQAWERYFIDTYSTINSTEDRARILEYGMMEYTQWMFEEKPEALEKLRYYSVCIRDAFDTTGWPEQLLWEQYL